MSFRESALGDLARRTLLSGRAHSYFAQAEGLPLSLKCMFNGRARYTIGRAEFCVDQAGYIVVNRAQPYSIEIASPTAVESLILWFPDGWAEEVWRSLETPVHAQLSDPDARNGTRVSFFERYIRHNTSVMPHVRAILAAYKSGVEIDAGWLEERLRNVLAAMLKNERGIQGEQSKLAALRPATREELWRRLHRGRDFLRARSSTAVTLSDAARVACLSPYHFLRSFKQAFGMTPHQFLTQCRLERAKFLLERTEIPVTDICFDAGFLSLGSFSALMHRVTGLSPRLWRAQHSKGAGENSKIREVFLTCRP